MKESEVNVSAIGKLDDDEMMKEFENGTEKSPLMFNEQPDDYSSEEVVEEGSSDDSDELNLKLKQHEELARKLKAKIDAKRGMRAKEEPKRKKSHSESKTSKSKMPLTAIDKFPEVSYEEGRVKWPDWRDLFFAILEANPHINTQVEKRAALLLRGGPTVFKIDKIEMHSPDEVEDLDDRGEKPVFENLIKRCNFYFKRYAHEAIDLQRFSDAKQKKDEPFMTFLDRLKGLGRLCNIKDTDLAFKMRVVSGAIHSSKLHEQGILLNSDLQTIIGVAMRIEASDITKKEENDLIKQEGEMLAALNQPGWHGNNHPGTFRNFAQYRQQYRPRGGRSTPYTRFDGRNPSAAKCGKCGRIHERNARCIADGKQCNKCSKFNHFAEVCRNLKTEPVCHVMSSSIIEEKVNQN